MSDNNYSITEFTLNRINLKKIPWVKYRAKSVMKCQATVSDSGKPCPQTGKWEYTALKKSSVQDGMYCYAHLVWRCVLGGTLGLEQDRLEKWYSKNKTKLNV